jgi:hypothetical protein
LTSSLQNHRLRSLITETLYKSIDIVGSDRCHLAVTTLLNRHDLAKCVRRLSLDPSILTKVGDVPQAILKQDELADMLLKLAPTIQNLERFDWIGFESPIDDLWLALRIQYVYDFCIFSDALQANGVPTIRSCPRLKSIGTSLGLRPHDPESHVRHGSSHEACCLLLTYFVLTAL